MNNKHYTKRKMKLSGYLKLLPGLCIAVNSLTIHAQSFHWVKNIGGSLSETGYGVSVDANSNVFATGYTMSTDCNFGGGGGIIASRGAYDVYLAKYDPKGNNIWARNMGGSGTDMAYSNAVDRKGNVYVTGYYASGTADFNVGGNGGQISPIGLQDAFLAKYDNDGRFLWAKSMGGSGNDQGYMVATDSAGNVFVAGHFASPVAYFNPIGFGSLNAIGGSQDVFLVKYDADGNYLWAKSMGGSGMEYCTGASVDLAGNVYIAGRFASTTADFNIGGTGGQVNNTGTTGYDAYVAKYDGSGNFQWVRVIGGSGNKDEQAYNVGVDPQGNSYTVGWFSSTTTGFQPQGSSTGYNSTGGSFDCYIVKYDPSGVYQWTKTMGGTGDDYAYAVAADDVGNVYVTGGVTKNGATPPRPDFNIGGTGGQTTDWLGDRDAYLAKYDVNGNFEWVKLMGGTNGDNGNSVAVSRSGNVFCTGYYWSTTADYNVGGTGGVINTVTSTATDAFLVMFGCNNTSSSSFEAAIECGATYHWAERAYTDSGSFVQVFPNVSGCDSTVTLKLTLIPMEKPVINVDSFKLGVVTSYPAYQWMKDDSLIPGETDSTYAVKANGNYRVIVTNEYGCKDTSDVYTVRNYTTGIDDLARLKSQIQVYPNPSADIVYIQAPVQMGLVLTDLQGRMLQRAEMQGTHTMSLKDLSDGVYLLHLRDKEGALIKTVKVVKCMW